MPDTGQAIQGYLDSLSQLPGSILYRDTRNWYALPPGDIDQRLTIGPAGLPIWKGYQGYHPAAQDYDGASGRFQNNFFSSGNKLTTIIRFASVPFTGGGVSCLHVNSNSAGRRRTRIYQFSSDHATVDSRNTIQAYVENSAGTVICRLYTPALAFLTGEMNYLQFEFNGDLGTAEFLKNGASIDNLANPNRIAPTTGTLGTGASSFQITGSEGGSNFFGGNIGAIGNSITTGINPFLFCTAEGYPLNLESSYATAWGGSPLAWHESGQLDQNRGSLGPATKTGTINLALPSTWH